MKRRHTGVFHRRGNRLAVTDAVGDMAEHVLEHLVAGGFLRDVQPFQNRHAGAQQGAEGAAGTGHQVLFHQLAKDRHLQGEQVPAHGAERVQPDQLDEVKEDERRQRNHHIAGQRQHLAARVLFGAVQPAGADDRRGVDQKLRHRRQLAAKVVENLFELRHDRQHDERQDADGHRDDHNRIDHRPLHLAAEGAGPLHELRQPAENHLKGTARLAGPNHVAVEAVEGLGALGHRLREG